MKALRTNQLTKYFKTVPKSDYNKCEGNYNYGVINSHSTFTSQQVIPKHIYSSTVLNQFPSFKKRVTIQ